MSDIPKAKIAGHGAKFSRKKDEAAAALASSRSVEEAARIVGLSSQTLYRWQKDPEFAAACDAVGEAILGQALGRLQQASGSAVSTLMNVMNNPKAPRSARLRAADSLLHHRKSAREMEKAWARLAELQRARETSRPERRGRRDNAVLADHGGSSQLTGRGVKYRRMKAAIAALLTQRNVEEAARVIGMGVTTLYRWMRDPEFDCAYREARLAAFGRASARLRQATGSAVSTIWLIMVDHGSSAAIQVRASDLALQHAAEASEKDIEEWASEWNRLNQGGPIIIAGGRRTFDEIVRLPPKDAA